MTEYETRIKEIQDLFELTEEEDELFYMNEEKTKAEFYNNVYEENN